MLECSVLHYRHVVLTLPQVVADVVIVMGSGARGSRLAQVGGGLVVGGLQVVDCGHRTSAPNLERRRAASAY